MEGCIQVFLDMPNFDTKFPELYRECEKYFRFYHYLLHESKSVTFSEGIIESICFFFQFLFDKQMELKHPKKLKFSFWLRA